MRALASVLRWPKASLVVRMDAVRALSALLRPHTVHHFLDEDALVTESVWGLIDTPSLRLRHQAGALLLDICLAHGRVHNPADSRAALPLSKSPSAAASAAPAVSLVASTEGPAPGRVVYISARAIAAEPLTPPVVPPTAAAASGQGIVGGHSMVGAGSGVEEDALVADEAAACLPLLSDSSSNASDASPSVAVVAASTTTATSTSNSSGGGVDAAAGEQLQAPPGSPLLLTVPNQVRALMRLLAIDDVAHQYVAVALLRALAGRTQNVPYLKKSGAPHALLEVLAASKARRRWYVVAEAAAGLRILGALPEQQAAQQAQQAAQQEQEQGTDVQADAQEAGAGPSSSS